MNFRWRMKSIKSAPLPKDSFVRNRRISSSIGPRRSPIAANRDSYVIVASFLLCLYVGLFVHQSFSLFSFIFFTFLLFNRSFLFVYFPLFDLFFERFSFNILGQYESSPGAVLKERINLNIQTLSIRSSEQKRFYRRTQCTRQPHCSLSHKFHYSSHNASHTIKTVKYEETSPYWNHRICFV